MFSCGFFCFFHYYDHLASCSTAYLLDTLTRPKSLPVLGFRNCQQCVAISPFLWIYELCSVQIPVHFSPAAPPTSSRLLRFVVLWIILTPVACVNPNNDQGTSSNLPITKAAINLASGMLIATVAAAHSLKRSRQLQFSNDAPPADAGPHSTFDHKVTTRSVRPRTDISKTSGRPVTAHRPSNSYTAVDIRRDANYVRTQSRLNPVAKALALREYYTFPYTSKGVDVLFPPGSLKSISFKLPRDLPEDMQPRISNTYTPKLSQRVLNVAHFGKKLNTQLFTGLTAGGLLFLPDSSTPSLAVPSHCICQNVQRHHPYQLMTAAP